MAYPQFYAAGDKRGANLVPRPSFPDTGRGAWSAGVVESRNVGGGVMRNRLGGFTLSKITLPGVPVAAASFRITALLTCTASSGASLGLRPAGSTRAVKPLAAVSGYQVVTFTDEILPTDTGTAVELSAFAPTSGQVGIAWVRVDYDDSPVAGYFDGDTADTADYLFAWDGTAFASPSAATAVAGNPAPEPDPEPEPEPEPEPTPASGTAARVATLLGFGDNPALLALAVESVAIVTEMARAYTRDRGFAGAEPSAPVAAVIATASARLAANGSGLPRSDTAGVYSQDIRAAFQGWTLAELAVLNRYRKRAA